MTTFQGLPANCPPSSAALCALTVFRRASGTPPTTYDMLSYAELGKVVKGARACQSHGLSVYTDRRDAEHNVKAFPGCGGTQIVEATLTHGDGVVAHTPNQQKPDSHHTWWPYSSVDRAALFK